MSSGSLGGATINGLDIAVIVLYFAAVIFVGLWMSRKNRGSVSGYFLAGRNMHWLPLGASLFASNVGSLHFVGLAGSGAAAGIGIATYELNAIFVVLMLGWMFVPVYVASGIYTMPEYLRKRFGGQRIRIYLAVLSLLLYVFTKISADLYAGAIFINQALGWNLYASVIFLLLIASLFTIAGGLTAVIWTDFIQTMIMMVGALTLMGIGFNAVGGYNDLQYKYERAVASSVMNSSMMSGSSPCGDDTCGCPREDYMHLFRDAKTGDIPWPGLIGITINSIWYWCADQVIVQRALAGESFSHTKAGTILCGYLKIFPLFIIVLPGMMSRILYTDDVACADPDECERVCGSPYGCTDIAYPKLVMELMPQGVRGLMLAVMLSALMSSLTSIFNSSSTIFTIDIWRKIRRSAKDTELMIVGRLCVLVLVVVSILWVPVIQQSQGSQLFIYIQQVSSYLQPPICAIFILGIFWKPTNEKGAFWALMLGLLTGGIRFILEFSYPLPECGVPDNRPNIIKDFHYLYFAVFLFLLTFITAIIISHFTGPIDDVHLHRLTFWNRHSKLPREDIDNLSIAEETEEETQEEKNIDEEVPAWYVRIGRWFCGIETQTTTLAEETKNVAQNAAISIEEKPLWRKLCDWNAILLMTVAVFVWAFYG